MKKVQKKKSPPPKSAKPKVESRQSSTMTLFEKSDSFFARHEKVWFWIIFAITLLTCVLLYDPRVSAGGDDSAYILMAHEFLTEFKFVNYQGPLYPIVLSVVEAIFGMSLKAFKTFSMLSMLVCVYVMFRAFRNRIPSTLLFITLLLTSFNSHILYFASQTYVEAFYMLMQSLLLLVFFNFFIHREELSPPTISAELKRHLLLAAALLAVVLTRSAGYSLFIAIAAYFMLYRQWKNIAWFTACFLACYAMYHLTVNILWDDVAIQASSQGSSLLNKDFYRPEYGRESLAGFMIRFWVNSNQYISRFFAAMLGLRETFTPQGFYVETIPLITVSVYLLGLTGLWFTYQQNKYLFFSGIVAGVFLLVTFVILQTFWNQYRLIVPAYSFMVLLLFSAVYYILTLPKLRSFQFLLFVPAVIIFFGMLSDTTKAAAEARKLKDEYSGLTPDWLHYAKASEWSAMNLPENALVACRKPSISMVYGKGKKFYGIYYVTSSNFDSFFERWQADSLSYSVISFEDMNNSAYDALLGHIEARILLGNVNYFAVKNRELAEQLAEQFEDLKIILSPQAFAHDIEMAGSQKSIYYPDSLLIPLRRANVTHILTANLRLNPNIKDGQIVNTVERVALFIQEKYPDIFFRLMQIGATDNEPAQVFQINWEVVDE